jgi:ribosomal protein S18 acetylase RimI-like enzyme
MSKDVNRMSKAERIAFYNSPEGKALDKKTYQKWKSLVNMSASELESFYNTKDGKEAGLSQSEANKQGISSGRESARWILKMKKVPYTQWTEDMWRWAKKQISFISRMSGNKGDLYDENGNKTRKHTSLLIWGHNPEKYNIGGTTKGKINTTFDSNNTDIRYKDGGEITSFKKGDNLVVLKYIDGDNELGHVDYYFDTNGINSEGLDGEPFNFNSEIYIDFIEVEKEQRGKGIAKKLLNRVIEDAKQLGIEVITLRRDSGMGCSYGGGYDDYLKKLYSSVGFVETWTQEDYDKSGGAKNLCAMHLDVNENKLKKGGGSIRKPKKRTISQTPAPKKDRIYGSKINKPNSAESKSKASSIILSPNVIKSIGTIIKEHNDEYPNKKVPLSSAKAVVRRGMGAYSSTHRPTIKGGKPNSRVAWGLARLNAFVYKIQKGYSKSGKYIQDDDLMNELGFTVKKYSNGGTSISFEYTIGGL